MFSPDSDRVVVRPMNSRSSSISDPLPSTSLSHVHISEALLQSPDRGATLDLTHRNLIDVGERGAEQLATIGREDAVDDDCTVLRLALSYNRLAALPMAFALLSRLRYLNLKSNSFSVFPDVLTVMPSLEILDVSRNKIKRLPSQPGSLANLRVLCFSRNKLSRLPAYIAKFRHLNVFKVDHNPIEWPPKSVMETNSGSGDGPSAKEWIRGVQKWIEDNVSRNENHRPQDNSTFDESTKIDDWPLRINDSDFDAGITPHARSFSMDSNFSVYSTESFQHISDLSVSSISLPDQRPSLKLGLPPTSYSSSTIRSRSPESYLPSPEESVISLDDDITSVTGNGQRHSRNASYAGGADVRPPQRPPLYGKKSLPDLRTVKFNFGGGKLPYVPGPRGLGPTKFPDTDFSMPSPLSIRKDSESSEGRLKMTRPFTRDPTVTSPTSTNRVPSMEVERNSYFRRLSAIPSTSISAAIPQSLLCLVDAARSILFAMCQVYQALQHYTVYAIDDRLSSVLKKVLDPASADMMQLINALDRFDASSRKTVPPPLICRAVIESCKDTVAVFGKAVGVLALQLKVLMTRDDVRFLRQMLLVLYGATAEISHAWQAMAPHIDAVKPLIRAHRRPPLTKSHTMGSPPGPVDVEPPSTSSTQTPFLSELPPLRPQATKGGTVKTRIDRRHAGSFSSKDVETGKKLPAYDDLPPFSGYLAGLATQNTTLRAGKRSLGPNSSVSVSSSPTLSTESHHLHNQPSISSSSGARQTHSRQGSQSSLRASLSSPSSPTIHGRMPTLEVPPSSRTLVDKEALDAMKVAVEAAPAVWEMIDEILGDVLEAKIDLLANLDRAKAVTERLRADIRAVQQGYPGADRKTLREDAHVFVRTVVQLSNVIKNHGGARDISSTLRSKMVKLTNATEEFVILLHVSSFSPSSTPRPYSPIMANGSGTSTPSGFLPGSSQQEDSGSTASLSRSKSAQPTSSLKLAVPTPRDGPRSALPAAGFSIPYNPKIEGRASPVPIDGPR